MIDALRTQEWVRKTSDGVQLTVRLTPGASRDDLDGVEQGADGRVYLKVRVRAIPEKGKANNALITLLAKRIGIAKSCITIASGETSRLKILMIAGTDASIDNIIAKFAGSEPD